MQFDKITLAIYLVSKSKYWSWKWNDSEEWLISSEASWTLMILRCFCFELYYLMLFVCGREVKQKLVNATWKDAKLFKTKESPPHKTTIQNSNF